MQAFPFENKEVFDLFETYPKKLQKKLLFLRELIFQSPQEVSEVGPIEEALRWGEPSYLTSESKSGSLVRIDWKSSKPKQYAMYFHCQTTLVFQFRELFPSLFKFEGNRCIIFHEDDKIPVKELKKCIKMAFTYHLRETKLI